MQNQEKSLLSDYLRESEKTLSGKFFYDEKNQNEPDVYHYSKLAIKATEELDLVKKKKYYGKDVNISSSAPQDLIFERDNTGENILHAAIGIVTEAGEILDAVLKHKYEGKELDVVNLKEEIGDIFWYFSILFRDLDIDLFDAMKVNIEKLRARYGEKFSSEKAINRDLATERGILEGKPAEIAVKQAIPEKKWSEKKWFSYAEDLNVSAVELEKLKNEMNQKFTQGETIETSVYKLSDASDVFGHLEDFDGDFSIKLLTNENEITEAGSIASFDLSLYKKEINSLETIALMFSPLDASDDDPYYSFIVLLSFNSTFGDLKLKSIHANYTELTLTDQHNLELNNFLNKNGIIK